MNPEKFHPDQIKNGHFGWLELTKYLKILSVKMNISNSNEHFFPILYTCIYYNPPMNPVKLSPDQIQNRSFVRIKLKMADLLPYLSAQIDKMFNKIGPSGWIFVSDA